MKEAETLARALGAKEIAIEVIQLRSELIAWYRRHGFEETGATRPFPFQSPRFGIPKRQDLIFIEMKKAL